MNMKEIERLKPGMIYKTNQIERLKPGMIYKTNPPQHRMVVLKEPPRHDGRVLVNVTSFKKDNIIATNVDVYMIAHKQSFQIKTYDFGEYVGFKPLIRLY